MLVDLSQINITKTKYSDHFCYYKNDVVIGQSLHWYGEYSGREIEFLMQFINKNAVVYDIGANIGCHSVAFASQGAKVFSFEPNPQNYLLLEKNVNLLDNPSNTTLFNCAVGDHNGTIFSENIDLTKVSNYGGAKLSDNNGVKVPLVTIDSLQLLPPTLIKIDVEGYELQVLRGAKDTIQKYKPIIYYEAHESKELAEIYDLLTSLGYKKLYWAMVLNYNPDNFKRESRNIFGQSCLFSIVAWPYESKISGLYEVLDRNDSYHRVINLHNETVRKNIDSI